MKRNLMSELKEGMDALTEDRHMTRDQLLKEYAAIIDEQREEIDKLQKQLDKEYERGYDDGVDAEYERNNFRKD
jgi:uncharacterized coiled-coil protein SlyX